MSMVLRRTDRIGQAAAEQDLDVLRACFIDNQDEISVLRDPADARCIVLGRTGAGKTALLSNLELKEERTISINPETLAIEHVANSTILRYLTDELNVRLDVFFKLLWRHVIAVELIKARYGLESEGDAKDFFGRVKDIFRSESEISALEYLRSFGSSFWQETHTRVKEVTSRVEDSFETSLGLTANELADIKAGVGSTFSEMRKQEVRHSAQRIISNVQARRLSDILTVVSRIIDDPQKPFFVNIDQLDESWVDDNLRYKLIRSLIDTAKEYNSNVAPLKINIAIRLDLLRRVFAATTDSGFQEEKFESLYVPVEWTKPKLIQVLDARVSYLFESKYTSNIVQTKDVVTGGIGNKSLVDYMIDRTLLRPRDLIIFFNDCIDNVDETGRITPEVVRHAEVGYSESRLRSLRDEWQSEYPLLLHFVEFFRGRDQQFFFADLDHGSLSDLCIQVATIHDVYQKPYPPHSLASYTHKLLEEEMSVSEFKKILVQCLFVVGFLGVQSPNESTIRWATSYRSASLTLALEEFSILFIHPTFHQALGIQ